MKRVVEFPLEDGGSVLVKVATPEEPGMVPAARGEVVERAKRSFEAALESIRPAAEVIIGNLRTLHDPPDEVVVEFGLKFSAEAGAFIAAAGTAANYKVTLTWKRESKEKTGVPD